MLALRLVCLLLSLPALCRARTILVTGATKGIGAAISAKFAAAGDRVVLHWRSDAAEAEAVRESLARSSAGEHVCLQADLAAQGSPAALVQEAIKQVGRIDVLVCNHGMYEETPIEKCTADEFASSFDRVMRTNLHAPAELAYEVARAMMKESQQGAIVFVSSRGARRGEPRAPAYGASKAALNSLTGSLAQALGTHGISVSAVAPGFIETNMAKSVLAGPRGDEIRAQSSWGRVGQPDEVAEAVYYLVSSHAPALVHRREREREREKKEGGRGREREDTRTRTHTREHTRIHERTCAREGSVYFVRVLHTKHTLIYPYLRTYMCVI